MNRVDVIFPVLNEELRLERGIRQTLDCINAFAPGAFKLLIVDNGSTDSTPQIARRLAETFDEVAYLSVDRRGVGLAFREGVARTCAPIVGYMDIDLATNPKYLGDVLQIFYKKANYKCEMGLAKPCNSVDIVNASRWACPASNNGRPFYRKVSSQGLVRYLKWALGLRASDAVCGFKFFRRESAESLINAADNIVNDWSYIIELLVRAEKSGMNIVELPVRWQDDGNSSVKVVPQTMKYLRAVSALRKRLKTEGIL